MARLAVTAFTLLLISQNAEANTFLARELSRHSASGDLLEQLEQVLGRDGRVSAEGRVERLEKALQPTFQAMPRSKHDRVDAAAVRYLLHRLFVDRHGWYVRGLDTEGEGWNNSSPVSIFQDGVGATIHGVFEERVETHGFSLHDVAVLAATLESFVHAETMERLRAAYKVMGIAQENPSEENLLLVMDTYMLMYVLGMNHSVATKEEVDESYGYIHEMYPNWDESRQWVRQIRQEVVGKENLPATSFGATVKVLEEMSDRYGRWQDRECHGLKDLLVNLEQAGTGRVLLTSFYGSALHNGTWQFGESKAYLRQLGALDESDVKRPSVIIPNYVNSPSNCVASSKFYSVCCINECEALMGHLESRVEASEATPKRIVEIIQSLPSSTVQAPRSLPGQLVQRLEQIAAHHDGHVPFHARLFMQWLHHAYPRECPYPHLSGTSKPVGPDVWKELTGEEPVVDEDTMRWHVQEAELLGEGELDDELPWSAEEELFVSRPTLQEPIAKTKSHVVGRGLMLAAAACSLVLTLFRMTAMGQNSVFDGSKSPQKYVL